MTIDEMTKTAFSRPGFWIFMSVVVLVGGNQFVDRVLDRFFPPPDIAAVEGISSNLQRINKNTNAGNVRLNRLVDSNRLILRSIEDITQELNIRGPVIVGNSERIGRLEMWKDHIGERYPPNRELPKLRGVWDEFNNNSMRHQAPDPP